jgi:hypothetical protein
MKILVWLSLLVAMSDVCVSESIAFLRIHQEVLEKRVKHAPATQAQRLTLLRKQFEQAGCFGSQLQEQPVPGEEQPNLICVIPGQANSTDTVLVTANSGYKQIGSKSLPQWGALEMLPLLAESINSSPRRYNFVFAAFTGGIHKHAGARYYLSQLSDAQRRTIRAVLYLDNLGRTPAVYTLSYRGQTLNPDSRGTVRDASNSDRAEASALEQLLMLSSRVLQLQPPSRLPDLSLGEAEPFRGAHIPAMTVQSSSKWPAPDLFTFYGKPVLVPKEKLVPSHYDDTYRLLCVALLYIDREFTQLVGSENTVR